MSPARPTPTTLHREWRLKPGIVFLNHGSFGACPGAILDLQSELRAAMEAEPVQFLWRKYEERLEPSRAVLAEFIGARSKDVVFVQNATAAVNAVLRSLKFERGDEILVTSLAYNACRNAALEIARQVGARIAVAQIPFPLRDENEIVEPIVAALTPRTRIAMIDHVTSDSGFILPIRRIIAELAARGVETLVDGAHAPGMVPLDFSSARVPAYYTGNLHKWVCAPKGAAFLWVREDRQDSVQPPVISHGNNRPRPGYTPFQDRFDWQGTIDPSPWFCVGAAIRWMAARCPGGWDEVRASNRQLALEGRRLLCDGFQTEPPCPESMIGSLAAIRLPDRFQSIPRAGKIDPEQLELYDRFGIEVPFNRIGEPPVRYLRISAQLYNQRADYQYLADTLESYSATQSP